MVELKEAELVVELCICKFASTHSICKKCESTESVDPHIWCLILPSVSCRTDCLKISHATETESLVTAAPAALIVGMGQPAMHVHKTADQCRSQQLSVFASRGTKGTGVHNWALLYV